MDLLAIRRLFPILGRSTYLNSCSLGALSLPAEQRLKEFTDLWHTRGASAWYDHWLGTIEELREGVAGLVHALPGEVALLPSTSTALAVVAESVDWSRRNRVVTTELDFPTLAYQFHARPDVEVVMLRSRDGVTIQPDQFAQAVDERTALLATSHVFFATGARQDLSALSAIARSAGAVSLIDGYHGVGQLDVDLPATGVDAYTTGPLKWLCGGPGLSYLYVREDLVPEWEPPITSWFAHARPFDFDVEELVRPEHARRFEMGTPALPTVHTALGGQEVIESVGLAAIEARNAGLARHLEDELHAAGFQLRMAEDPSQRTAIVMVAHARPSETVAALAAQGIIVDHRPGHIRVSPHFYNSREELDRFVEVLEALPR